MGTAENTKKISLFKEPEFVTRQEFLAELKSSRAEFHERLESSRAEFKEELKNSREGFHNEMKEFRNEFRQILLDAMRLQRDYMDKRFDKLEKILYSHIGQNAVEHSQFNFRLTELESPAN